MSEKVTYYMSDVSGIERSTYVERTTPPAWVRAYKRMRAQHRTKRNADPRSALLRKIKLEELCMKIRKFNETR